MKVIVDTNIIIDALTSREPFREMAEQIFILAANQIEEMYITANAATDIYYIIRKYLHNTDLTKEAMAKLYELFYILDITADDCHVALHSNLKDYEDAVVSCCAVRNQMDYIITRNIKDFEESKVEAILPEEFIKMVSYDEE